jgi:hypothetical protein
MLLFPTSKARRDSPTSPSLQLLGFPFALLSLSVSYSYISPGPFLLLNLSIYAFSSCSFFVCLQARSNEID